MARGAPAPAVRSIPLDCPAGRPIDSLNAARRIDSKQVLDALNKMIVVLAGDTWKQDQLVEAIRRQIIHARPLRRSIALERWADGQSGRRRRRWTRERGDRSPLSVPTFSRAGIKWP